MLPVVAEEEYYRDPNWLKYGGKVMMECLNPTGVFASSPTLKA